MQYFRLISFIWNHPLNKKSPWKAIGRLFRWQISARLLPEAIFGLPFVNNTKLFMRLGMTGATGNLYCGLHEMNDMGFVLHVLRPNDLFIDIGANIGSYTVLAAGGTGAQVITVEPISSTYQQLCLNLKLNNLEANVESHCLGLSDHTGILQFTSTQDTVNHILADGEIHHQNDTENVQVTTLDNLMAGRNPTLLKIDVEGHEMSVLEGSHNTLESPNLLAIIMEINGSGKRYGIEDSKLLNIMNKYGFSCWNYDAIKRTLKKLEESPETIKDGNIIFLRNHFEVEQRIKTAPNTKLINGVL